MFTNATPENETAEFPDILSLEELNEVLLGMNLPAIIYTAVLMLVGTPGNIVVIYIYYFKWRRSTSRMFILYLALLDLVNCLTTLPIEIYIMNHSVSLDIPFLCKLSRFSTYTMNSSSALILIGIAVDRFRRICKPYKRTFSESNSKQICIGAILISLILTWPAIVLYGTRHISIGVVTGSSCLIENKFDSTPFPIIFLGFMGFMTVVIFTALSVLYYFIGLQIYKHRVFKIKRCSQVEKIVEEHSTEKSKSGGLPKNNSKKSLKENKGKEAISNGIHATHEAPEATNNIQNDQHKIKKDNMVIQNCELLGLPVNNMKEVSSDKISGDCSTKNMDLESHSHIDVEVSEHCSANGKASGTNEKESTPKIKVRRTNVRYLLVRESSTLNSSGRTKCIDCLTIRVGKSTLMLFTITVVYIVSFLPFYILALIRQSSELFVEQLTPAGFMAYQVFLRSYLLSSAVNPVVYSFCNAEFRRKCVDLFERILLRKTDSPVTRSIFR